MSFPRLAAGLLALALSAFGGKSHAQTSIQGEILGVNRAVAANTGAKVASVQNAEIQILRQDNKTPLVSVRTDANGKYAIGTLPPGVYAIKIFVDGNLEFAAANLRTRVGDPLRIDYNMRTAVVSMSSATSKRTRRFAWQQPATGSHLDGRWIETDAVDGYEAPFSQVQRKSGFAVFQASRGF